MKNRIEKTGTLTFVVLMLCSSVGAAEPPRLASNPFARPPSVATVPERPLIRPDGSTQELDLQATLVATSDRLANVAGRILRPGDEVQGYTLLKVYEDRAVFKKNGDRLTIYVKPDLEEDDE